MASSAPTPLRQALEERVRQLVVDTENLFTEARDRARRDLADQLNQAVRRIRQTANPEELAGTLLDASAPFCGSAAWLAIRGEAAVGERVRGVDEEAARKLASFEIPLAKAQALAGAASSGDPVVTATTPGEVSEELVELLGHGPAGRASIFPIVTRGRAVALLYAWGSVQGPAMELLAQVASFAWSAWTEPPPAPAADLVTIAPLAVADVPQAQRQPQTPPKSGATWEQLSPDDQRVHFRAQRFARVQVSEMRLFEGDAVQSGRAHRNLYEALHTRIDAAREKFHQSFFAQCPSMVDYLHLELVRTLANDDAELLGDDYPGPLV